MVLTQNGFQKKNQAVKVQIAENVGRLGGAVEEAKRVAEEADALEGKDHFIQRNDAGTDGSKYLGEDGGQDMSRRDAVI